MTARLVQLGLLVLLLWSTSASANRYVTYVVRPSDTIESIAAEYYGNRARALFIVEFNGLPRGSKLKPGQTIRIPTSYRYKLAQNEGLGDVAARLLGDRRRGPLLLPLSEIPQATPIKPGMEVQIPFHFYHLTKSGETLSGIARTYYGDAGQAKLLAFYNFRQSPNQTLALGERLVIPITHVRVRSVRMPSKPQQPVKRPVEPVQKARAPQSPVPPDVDQNEAEKREAELAAKVRHRMQESERQYREGNYAAVPAELIKLLSEYEPSEKQLIEVHRLLAFAYVALGETELAVRAMREVLDRKPDFQLDPATTSPKIRVVLDRARFAP